MISWKDVAVMIDLKGCRAKGVAEWIQVAKR